MKIACLGEHIATPGVIAAWRGLDLGTRDLAVDTSIGNDKERRLLDLADLRPAPIDEAGIDIGVVSHTTPGVQSLGTREAVALAREANV